jgi:ABC-2 type transport system ATP-binding protein
MIYCGLVDEMNKNFGSVFVNAVNKEQLLSFIKTQDYFGSVTESLDGYEVLLLKEIDTAQLNELAFKNGISLSRLTHKKQSLEDQFIALTNNN